MLPLDNVESSNRLDCVWEDNSPESEAYIICHSHTHSN